jgi:hypothetical protein
VLLVPDETHPDIISAHVISDRLFSFIVVIRFSPK